MITTTYDPEQWQLVPKALSDEMFEMISTQGWKSILEVAPAHPQCDWVDANGNPPHPSVQEKMVELINNEKVYTQLIGMSYRECRDLLDHRLGHISRLKEELAIALAAAPQHESQWQPDTSPDLESRDFYEVMQAYRHEPLDAHKQFEAVKAWLRNPTYPYEHPDTGETTSQTVAD